MFVRNALNTLRNHGGKITLRAPSPALDGMVADGYVLRNGLTYTYTITAAGEDRLLDRSDITPEQEATIARRAMREHEDTARDRH